MIASFTGGHAFLSNFAPTPFAYPQLTERFAMPTAEHAYQASKAQTEAEMERIATAPTPGEAKARGRATPLPPWWQARSRAVMLDVLLAKFASPGLAAALAATGSQTLVEGNRWGDVWWGAVRPGRTSGRDEPLPWWGDHFGDEGYLGHNWLGRLLMMTREVLS